MKSTFLRITSVALCFILCALALSSCSLLDKFINKKDDVPNDTVFEYSGIENFTLESDETDALSQYSSIHEATWKTIIAKDFFIYYQNSDSGTVGAETFVPDTITCKDGKLTYHQPPLFSHTLYADYYWYEIGDVIGIGDNEFSYFCFPPKNVSVTKARLATEELYKMKKPRRRARSAEAAEAEAPQA